VEAGWAFQLQDPRTVMLLLLLATAITANLLGLFELPVIGGRLQPAGSFGTGALAAFVATPCAGPFLGAALGTALLLPFAGGLLVFAALGLGLALPFVVLAFVPQLQDRLPKPGLWMRRLQRFLAIPMAASAIAALWLLDRQAGHHGLIIGITAALELAVLLVAYGVLQHREARIRWAPLALAVTLSGAGIAVIPSIGATHAPIAGAEKWSPARVAAYKAQGKPVFVYFTADWCLSCKVNETTSIDRGATRQMFRRLGVKVLVGDWTNGDPEITRFLESQGRAGVPLYLWYYPGESEPRQLPQILTSDLLREYAVSRPGGE
jgi:thiol:disulfide interchange protein